VITGRLLKLYHWCTSALGTGSGRF